MSEFRHDDVTGRWVIIAPERAARPNDFPVERRKMAGGFCPFCEGHEDKTPPEVMAIRHPGAGPNRPGWQVRVVPNRFPALQPEKGLQKSLSGRRDHMTGFGIHEVIIDTPKHVLSIGEIPPEEVRSALAAYRDRLQSLVQDRRIEYGMLFKNVGVSAGATIEHSHTQLIGLPVIPDAVEIELSHAKSHHRSKGKCLFCAVIEEELAAGVRVAAASEHFVAITPYAARFPFETWILPRKHGANFEQQDPATYGDLAQVLCNVLQRMDAALSRPAYNYLIHTAPFRTKVSDFYHWHIEIIPSVTRAAGFEWGTGIYINPVAPESAAAFLAQQRGIS